MRQPDRRPPRKLPWRTRAVLGGAVVSLLLPIAVYIWTFGASISTNHARWGEMGSAMSGIYSPVLAFLALLVVYGQLKSQNRFNEHEIDQRFIEQSRSDIQYYLEQLDRVLQLRDPNGATVREMLHQHFIPRDQSDLKAPALVNLGKALNRQYPQPIALWGAIYPILAGLQAADRYPYIHNVSTSVQKIVAMTTFETGVALDNFHYCVTEGRVWLPYQFSPFLRSEP